MGTYKVGDKFVLEIEDIDEYGRYHMKDIGAMTVQHKLDKLPQLVNGVDMASYNKGMEDAWEVAFKLYSKTINEVNEIAERTDGMWGVLLKMTAHEAKEKLEAYENRIRYGDEVEYTPSPNKVNAVVVNEDGKYAEVLFEHGTVGVAKVDDLIKTGNNYAAELKELLGKIGGESE